MGAQLLLLLVQRFANATSFDQELADWQVTNGFLFFNMYVKCNCELKDILMTTWTNESVTQWQQVSRRQLLQQRYLYLGHWICILVFQYVR